MSNGAGARGAQPRIGPDPTTPSGPLTPATRAAQARAADASAAGRTQSFTLQTPDGRTQTFGSRLEAQAAQVRRGGTIR